ncbi:MAG: FAD-dependent oxidoreductase [Gammaproteobacteria bacterium]|nr:FAD-dependent oxidoreductase [Gammaproteobacteria bacterium]MBU1722351.1 FAD-dependent oxidoreductase [Gammaproteobacteria bacterium]MBU2004712.1 FAD-dependent oxidoreductase [Gammaproteobacteria bacterium]
MKVDVLIVGGGIAGLWLLAELRAQGINALLATDELGKGQTIASQGIIHGGTKYALTGKLTGAAMAIGEMPRIWRAALNGEGSVDLSKVNILAESQLLWTSGGIGSRMTGFFASKAMKSRMDAVPHAEYPELFRHPAFHGGLYRLDEPVLDVPALLACLREQLADALVQVDVQRSGLQQAGNTFRYHAVLPDGSELEIDASQIVLTAGAGNEALMAPLASTPLSQRGGVLSQRGESLLERCSLSGVEGSRRELPTMQRRPLQMVMLRGGLPMIYAHALGMSDKPRATITSHKDAQGQTVWYIGGQPAEQGVGKPAAEVIAATRHELAELLPWVDFDGMEWATWNVDRAEGCQPDGSRPDQPAFFHMANVTLAWPTKLAFAPMLASSLQSALSVAKSVGKWPVESLPTPPVAHSIWNEVDFIRL